MASIMQNLSEILGYLSNTCFLYMSHFIFILGAPVGHFPSLVRGTLLSGIVVIPALFVVMMGAFNNRLN